MRVSGLSASPLRPVICSAGELWGGVEQFIVTLCLGLRDRGVDGRVVLFHEGRLSSVLRGYGITTDVVSGRHPYDPKQITELRQRLVDYRANLVHAHGYKATVTAALAIRGLKRGSVRLIKTEHGLLEPPSTWRAIPSYLRLAANVAADTIACRAAADRVIYVSDDTRRVRTRWCGRGEVIYNGITPPAIATTPSRPQGTAASPFTVGIVGRLTAVKGHIFMFRALTKLPDVHLKVCGNGPDEAFLREAAQRMGIADRVDFAGFVSPIQDAMAMLDVLAIPSLHEGLPYTVLEAMAFGVPVVASRVGGLVEAIEDGVSGLLVPPRDPDALAAAIRRIQMNADEAESMRRRAKERVTSCFHADRMVERYLETYADVVS